MPPEPVAVICADLTVDELLSALAEVLDGRSFKQSQPVVDEVGRLAMHWAQTPELDVVNRHLPVRNRPVYLQAFGFTAGVLATIGALINAQEDQ